MSRLDIQNQVKTIALGSEDLATDTDYQDASGQPVHYPSKVAHGRKLPIVAGPTALARCGVGKLNRIA